MGNRYLCAVCQDYDLCDDCLSQTTEDHLPAHPLVVIPGGITKQAAEVQCAVAFAQGIFKVSAQQDKVTATPLETFVCGACDDLSGGQSGRQASPLNEGKEQRPALVSVCGLCGQVCCASCKLCSLGHKVTLRLLTDDPAKLAACVAQAKTKLAACGKVEEKQQPPPAATEKLPRKKPLLANARDSLKIRLMTHKDLDDVLAVEAICFTDPYPRSTFEQLLTQKSTRLFVAQVLNEEVCGYILLDVGAKAQAKIVSLATRPDCRGHGAASGLLQAALQAAATKAVSLHVHVDNTSAQRLYLKHGFVITARLPDYYHQKRQSGRVVPRTGDAFAMVCSAKVDGSARK